jgi:hypothetical protein
VKKKLKNKLYYYEMYKLITLCKKFSSVKISIRNKDLPICSNCLYFIEHTNNYPYDPIPSNEKYGKCKKFGEVDLVTGIIEYDFAKNCRLNDNKCGTLGSEYKNKMNS